MLEEREVFAAIVALVASAFFLINWGRFSKAPHPRLLLASFVALAASLVCSVVEVFVWEEFFNFLQHALAPSSLVLLAIWSWLTFARHGGVSA